MPPHYRITSSSEKTRLHAVINTVSFRKDCRVRLCTHGVIMIDYFVRVERPHSACREGSCQDPNTQRNHSCIRRGCVRISDSSETCEVIHENRCLHDTSISVTSFGYRCVEGVEV